MSLRIAGLTLEVVDAQGRPVQDAYVAYHREGDLGPWTLVDRIQYDATPMALARGNDAGLAGSPGAWVWHWPIHTEEDTRKWREWSRRARSATRRWARTRASTTG